MLPHATRRAAYAALKPRDRMVDLFYERAHGRGFIARQRTPVLVEEDAQPDTQAAQL